MKVIYSRDPDVGNGFQAYRGRFEWKDSIEDFLGAHFESLIRRIHNLLPPDDFELLFIRTDRPELPPYPLEENLVRLIKDKPEEAIQAMSHPDIRVEVGRAPQPTNPLRSCGENLAASFGEQVLIRQREGRGECPGCGTWAPTLLGESGECRIKCDTCSMNLEVERCDDEWFFIRVGHLLSYNRGKYFLPREWNGFHPWIGQDDLTVLYMDFLKQKEKF